MSPPRRHLDPGAGVGCWTCLDFRHLEGLGPCPDCRPDAFAEYLLAHAVSQQARTHSEEQEAGR